MRRVRRRMSQCGRDALHRGENHPSEFTSARTTAARSPHVEHGRGHDQGALWQLHQSWRVRSGLPQENSHRVHRKDEPRPDSRNAPSPRQLGGTKFLRLAACRRGSFCGPVWVAEATYFWAARFSDSCRAEIFVGRGFSRDIRRLQRMGFSHIAVLGRTFEILRHYLCPLTTISLVPAKSTLQASSSTPTPIHLSDFSSIILISVLETLKAASIFPGCAKAASAQSSSPYGFRLTSRDQRPLAARSICWIP